MVLVVFLPALGLTQEEASLSDTETSSQRQEATGILESINDAFFALDRDWCLALYLRQPQGGAIQGQDTPGARR